MQEPKAKPMASAFAWLNEVMAAFGQVFPRLRIVRKTYVAVVFRHNGTVKIKKPGLLMYWPVVHEIRLIPTTVRCCVVSKVAVDTEDTPLGIPVNTYTGSTCFVRVVDAEKVIEVFNISSFTLGLVRKNLVACWNGTRESSLADLRLSMEADLQPFGIEVTDLSINDSYRLVGWGQGGYQDSSFDWTPGDEDTA